VVLDAFLENTFLVRRAANILWSLSDIIIIIINTVISSSRKNIQRQRL